MLLSNSCKHFFFFPLIEFLINFKTIMKAHLVLSQSWVRFQNTGPDRSHCHKNLTIKPKKKNEAQKQDLGLHFKYHGTRITFL